MGRHVTGVPQEIIAPDTRAFVLGIFSVNFHDISVGFVRVLVTLFSTNHSSAIVLEIFSAARFLIRSSPAAAAEGDVLRAPDETDPDCSIRLSTFTRQQAFLQI